MTRFTMGLSMDVELESYATAPMPTQMPADTSEFTLDPGSMLFVPRGSWHSTQAVTDALALNFTFSAPTWIDIFTTVLRARLSHSPEWRDRKTSRRGLNLSTIFSTAAIKVQSPKYWLFDLKNKKFNSIKH